MQPGLHLIQFDRLPDLTDMPAIYPQSYMGILDLARMIHGLIPEPTPAQPLGILGLEILLATVGSAASEIMSPLRQAILDGKYYFEWKEIPLVFLVHGELQVQSCASGAALSLKDRRWDLTPLFGKYISPKLKDDLSWWWSSTLH